MIQEITILEETNLPDPSAKQLGLFAVQVLDGRAITHYNVDYYTTDYKGENILFVSNAKRYSFPIGSVSKIKKNFTGPLKVNRVPKNTQKT